MSQESGQYQLSILLKLNDQLSGGLNKTVTGLRKFGTESRKALKDYEALRRGISKPISTANIDKLVAKYRSGTKDIRAFGTEQGKLGTRLNKPVSTTGLDAQLQKLQQYRRQLRATAKDSDTLRTSMRAPLSRGGRLPTDPLADDDGTRRRRPQARGGFIEGVQRADDLLQSTRQIGYAWRERADSLRPYVNETLRLVRAQEKFKAIGLSDKDNAEAFAAVNKQVEGMKGISLTDATETITDLHTALGDLHHAIDAFPIASKYRFAFSTIFGDKFSNEEIEEQLRSGMKFLEMTGKVAKGREEMERSFNVMAQMSAATGGRVNPAEMLLMARRGGPSIQGLTPTGLRNMSSAIQELGGEGAGTALMAQYQALVGGVMKKSSLAEFQRLGLIDSSKIETGKHSDIIKKVLPGANKLGALMQEDPLKAADRLLGAFADKGIIQRDTLQRVMAGGQFTDAEANKVREELTILFQNRNSQRLMSLLTTQRNQVVKESGLAGGAKDIEGLYGQANTGAIGDFQKYEAAMTNLRATLGKGIIPLMTTFAHVATPVAEFFATYPGVGKFATALLLLTKVTGGAIQTFSILSQTQAINTLSRIQTEAIGAAGGISAAEKRAIGLSSGLRSLPTTIKIGLVLGAAWFTLQQILELYSASGLADRAQKEVQGASAMSANALRSMEAIYASKGEQVPKAEYAGAAKSIYQGLNVDSQLSNYLDPSRESLYHKFFAQGTNPFRDVPSEMRNKLLTDKAFTNRVWQMPGDYGVNLNREMGIETAASHIRKQGQELDNPGAMLAFRQKVSTGNYPQDAKNTLNEALQRAFPASYAASGERMALEFSQVADKSRMLVGIFGDLFMPVKSLPPAFGQATFAATNFANDVGNIQLPSFIGSGLGGLLGPQAGAQPAPQTLATAIPSRAIGGIVERDGVAMVHAGNTILPVANITRGLAGSTRGGVSSHKHYNITLNVTGNVKDSQKLSDEIVSKLEARIKELDRTLHDADHFDRMGAMAIDYGSERA
jgi:hypothetical protein